MTRRGLPRLPDKDFQPMIDFPTFSVGIQVTAGKGGAMVEVYNQAGIRIFADVVSLRPMGTYRARIATSMTKLMRRYARLHLRPPAYLIPYTSGSWDAE